jgi:hypothetical protein
MSERFDEILGKPDPSIERLTFWTGYIQHDAGPANEAEITQIAVEFETNDSFPDGKRGIRKIRTVRDTVENAHVDAQYHKTPDSPPALILKREVTYGPWRVVGIEKFAREGWY